MFSGSVAALRRALGGSSPTPSPGGEPAATTPSYIDALLADAELIATYGRYAGSFRDDLLLVTLGRVHDLEPPRRTSHEAVVKLQMILNDASKLIPFTTLTELKSGWTPHQSAKGFWRRTAGLLVISIALMVVTTQLTYKYNKASTILQELAVLSSSDVRQDFNQLIRDFMQAKGRLNDPQPNEASVAWPAYLASEAELAALSDRLAVGYAAGSRFVSDDARFLVWPSRQVYCLLRSPPESRNDVGSLAEWQTYTSYCGMSGLDVPDALSPSATPLAAGGTYGQQASANRCVTSAGAVPASGTPGTPTGTPTGAPETAGPEAGSFAETAQSLACAGVISFPPDNFQGFASFTLTIQETLTFLALGILPALYGALGTVMYHMRMILDPLRPNPPFFRVFHRALLGALAGIVLSWLFIPDTAVGDAFAGIGFSLFVLAFLFGFSLDVFFAILDRFVNLSVSGIGRFGTQQPVQVVSAPFPSPPAPAPAPAPPSPSPPSRGPAAWAPDDRPSSIVGPPGALVSEADGVRSASSEGLEVPVR